MMSEYGRSREWQQIEKLLHRSYDEQRNSRRWGILFKSLTFGYLFLILFLFQSMDVGGGSEVDVEHTALVDLVGTIASDKPANADAIVAGLTRAFEATQAKGVILRINSPGGSPVQSDFIFDALVRLREMNAEKKVYAVISDIGTSGGYYIASGADEIYAADASIVGSIGVIAANFGFVEAMDKLGVERRVIAAGTNKAMLDPFMEENPEDLAHFKTLLTDVHEQFIESVIAERGDKLDMQKKEQLFSGKVWTGRQAVSLGLVDGISSAGELARDVIGAEKVIDYTLKPDPLEAMFRRFSVSIYRAFSGVVDSVVSGIQLR